MTPTIIALVPMKHHSQRVPEKNFRLLAGRPLYFHILETLTRCAEINAVAVDTDSPIIKQGLEAHFPEVQIIDRPPELCGDAVSMNDILIHDTGLLQADYFLQTHSTNPLLQAETISTALQFFLANTGKYDSLFTVTPWRKRLWKPDGTPLNHDPAVLLQTQDLEPVFEENSCMYVFTRENLLKNHNRLGNRPAMFAMDSLEAMDIDDENEFAMVASILDNRNKPGTKEIL